MPRVPPVMNVRFPSSNRLIVSGFRFRRYRTRSDSEEQFTAIRRLLATTTPREMLAWGPRFVPGSATRFRDSRTVGFKREATKSVKNSRANIQVSAGNQEEL